MYLLGYGGRFFDAVKVLQQMLFEKKNHRVSGISVVELGTSLVVIVPYNTPLFFCKFSLSTFFIETASPRFKIHLQNQITDNRYG